MARQAFYNKNTHDVMGVVVMNSEGPLLNKTFYYDIEDARRYEKNLDESLLNDPYWSAPYKERTGRHNK